jgi:hypothetical protein
MKKSTKKPIILIARAEKIDSIKTNNIDKK